MDIQKKYRVDLIEPITFEGAEHHFIEIRRIKAKDLRTLKSNADSMEETLYLIQKLSEWPKEGIDELDQADIESIAEIIQGFSKKRRH